MRYLKYYENMDKIHIEILHSKSEEDEVDLVKDLKELKHLNITVKDNIITIDNHGYLQLKKYFDEMKFIPNQDYKLIDEIS